MKSYLPNQIKLANYYKDLGEKAMHQLSEHELFWQPDEESNCVAVIVKHISGNMLSRWTDFLSSDGEKDWRNRDGEFESTIKSRTELLAIWERGWDCFLGALESLSEADLDKTVYIRNEGHSVVDAINRQMAHYPYHMGQIVFLAKLIREGDWESLSIPKNKSADYNKDKFGQDQADRHFTDKV